MKTLDQIALETNTDKNSKCHNYCEKYEKYLRFDRNKPIKILEIGVFRGESISMWSQYYHNKETIVVGLDIDQKCKQYENLSKNIFVEIGSQTDKEFLKKIINKYDSFDLIIDDGSHLQTDVIFSFEELFDSLNSQGVYIVEDTGCAYWPEFGGSVFNAANSSISYLKSLVDHVHFFGQKLNAPYAWHHRREDLHIDQLERTANYKIKSNIESINFLNGTVLVTKR